VDAPATGHGLAFLNVPQVVAQAVRVGPLKTKAEGIMKLVQDPKKCLLLIVTLAEEMPVNEALEMLASAQSLVKVKTGPVIANALYPSRLSESEWKEIRPLLNKIEKEEWVSSLEKAVTAYQKKVLLQHFYVNKLQMRLGNREVIELPTCFAPF
jgi:anion-transporting  ArsA/GET3 family ATPase